MPTSTYLFALQLPFKNLVLFIREAGFTNELLREFISLHEFKQCPVHELLLFVLFSAADLLTLFLFVKISREQSVPIVAPIVATDNAVSSFSPRLSPVTSLASPPSYHSQDQCARQVERDDEEQNACHLEDLQISGLNGQFWDDLEFE